MQHPTQPPYPPSTANWRVPVFETCAWCHGSGKVEHALPYCARCLKQWTPAYLAAHLGHHWDFSWNPFEWFATRLPCGHRLKHLQYSDPTCTGCKGAGGRWNYLSLAALRHMSGWFDRARPQQFGVDGQRHRYS